MGSGAYLLACLDGRRGQGSGEARPRSGRRALGPAPGGVENVGRRGVAERWWFWAWVLHLGDVGVMGLVLVSVDALRGGDSPVAGVSHPFAGRLCTRRRAWGGGMMRFVGSWPVWSIRTRDRARGGGHDLHDRAPTKRTGVAGASLMRPPGAARGPARRAARSRRARAGGGPRPRWRCSSRGGPRPVRVVARRRCAGRPV